MDSPIYEEIPGDSGDAAEAVYAEIEEDGAYALIKEEEDYAEIGDKEHYEEICKKSELGKTDREKRVKNDGDDDDDFVAMWEFKALYMDENAPMNACGELKHIGFDKMLEELRMLKADERLQWSRGTIRNSLKERSPNDLTLFQEMIRQKDVQGMKKLWDLCNMSAFSVEVLSYYKVTEKTHEEYEASLNDANKRDAYNKVYKQIQKYRSKISPINDDDANWNAQQVLRFLKEINNVIELVLYSASCACDGPLFYLISRISEILVVVDYDSHNSSTIVVHLPPTECFLCELQRTDKQMLRLILQYLDKAVRQMFRYLQAFMVFDALCHKTNERKDEILLNWRNGFEKLKALGSEITILQLALVDGDPLLVSWLLDIICLKVDFLKVDQTVDWLGCCLVNKKTDYYLITQVLSHMQVEVRRSILERQRAEPLLFQAVQEKSLPAILALCQNGAIFDAHQTRNGKTVLNLASEMKLKHIEAFFLDLVKLFKVAARGDQMKFHTAMGKFGDLTYEAKLHVRNGEKMKASDLLREALIVKTTRRVQ